MSKIYKRYVVILAGIIAVLSIASWLSKPFCDWYIKYVFVIWLNIYGRITNLFPFSVGELMIILALLILLFAIVMSIIAIFKRKNKRYINFFKGFCRILLAIFLNVCLIMTLNCTTLYHCTRLDPNKQYEKRQYSLDELEKLYGYVVDKCNYYADKMDRDADGYIVYDSSIDEQSRLAIKNIKSEYKRLKGYYPRVKKMFFSGLMSQAGIGGYYFPFSMEANVNRYMYILNFPNTYCHELAHLHGYIYEDEANFLGFLACISSEDDFFKYSGYMSVVNYLRDAYLESLEQLDNKEAAAEKIKNRPKLSEAARRDNIFLKNEDMERIKSHSILDTKVVGDLSDNITDMSLKANGVVSGSAAYGEVVDLLLQYYEGKLY